MLKFIILELESLFISCEFYIPSVIAFDVFSGIGLSAAFEKSLSSRKSYPAFVQPTSAL